MSLETGTRIQDLVPTNPVGATDFASQGDDHIRLIKACLQGSLPSLGATAVTLTGAQINDAALKSATQSVSGAWTFSAVLTASAGLAVTGNFSVATGTVTLPAASIADAALSANIPLKNASNAFSTGQAISAASGVPGITITNNAATTDALKFLNGVTRTWFMGPGTGTGADDFALLYDGTRGSMVLRVSNAGNIVAALPGSGSTLTVVGSSAQRGIVIQSGGGQAAQLSFQESGQTESAIYQAAGSNSLVVYTKGQEVAFFADGLLLGTATGGDKGLGTINATTLYQAGVKAQQLPVITSTSTTLAKGQLHHISGNATLPALGDGEWVCLVNNSGSPITITEHSGDTTYYTSYGVSVSTVTVPARGRLFASGAGSSVVYVSGDISGYT